MSVRGLVPYALVAVLIAAGSSLAVVSTAHPVATRPPASAAPTPVPSGARIPELSRTSRLAYWRDGRLWVSNVDGSLRRAVTDREDTGRIALTRWTADGGGVSFVEGGATLSLITPEGARTSVTLPIDLRLAGYRIADVRWSPDGRRAATTLLRPNDGRSDAFVIDMSAPRPAFTRVTTLEDLFAADWISNDEFLAYTALGVMGIVRASGSDEIRLLSGATGVSPVIGPEGRVHFLAGRVSFARGPSLAYVTASRASVWSAATDGSDVRRESAWEIGDVRLDARLPDGRYLVHRGSNSAQATVTEEVVDLPANAGVVERVRVSPDGRSAYGFTAERIVRIDLTRLGAPAAQAAGAAVSVFLDTSGEADVWFPSQLSLARGGERAAAAPAARYAFQLGGHAWLMENGVATLLRPAPLARRTATPVPRWSPGAEHLVLLEQAGPTGAASTLVAVAFDRAGGATRLTSTVAAGRSFSWSPTGSELAIAVDRKGVTGLASDAQLEIRFVDPTGRQTRSPIAANEVAWTSRSIYLLDGSALLRLEGEGPARPIARKEQIATDARIEPSRSQSAAVTGLDAAADGTFASVRLQLQDANASRTYLVIVGADGIPAQYVRADALSDAAWSPARALLGYTLDARTSVERAVVMSPADGKTLTSIDGRFAGWSPDGQWFFVGKVTGLYAFRLDGGDPVRVGPAGVPVSAAPR